MRSWLKQYFTFNSGERRAIIAIIVVTVVVVAGINAYRYFTVKQNAPSSYTNNTDAFIAAYNAAEGEEKELQIQHYLTNYKDTVSAKPSVATTLFKFDPNTISIAEWMKLGFSEKQAASIEKYKAKGGTFYKVEDLKKLYVVSDEDYNRLAPYVDIKPIAAKKLVNINTADSASIEALPGIGALLTHRILEYRAKQGKFKSVEDLRNIKGMSEENYNKAAPHISVSQ